MNVSTKQSCCYKMSATEYDKRQQSLIIKNITISLQINVQYYITLCFCEYIKYTVLNVDHLIKK